ncbi:MAG: hypothetical protein PHT59_03030 [Candidatus Omnitrophica bacterium]|nr:hypothetical protein [Candidatus Omnitrophota bacterium]
MAVPSFARSDQPETTSITTYHPDPVKNNTMYKDNSLTQGVTYYNGAGWQAQPGSVFSGAVVVRSCPWQFDYRERQKYSNGTYVACYYGWGNQCGIAGQCCDPPACPDDVNWTDVGTEAIATSVSCPNVHCHWDNCNEDDHPMTTGMVIRICVKK